jgi:hypothetical protein
VSQILFLLLYCFVMFVLATSVDVERVFSQGQIVLSHLRSRLSVQSTRALMCLGVWSRLGYVNDSDIEAVIALPGVPANEKEEALPVGWDAIDVDSIVD